jgi:uncharacterized DUF497 family protein
MPDLQLLSQCSGFDWDEGNVEKNWITHKVSTAECEQIFFNQPLVVTDDVGHSQKEKRFYALGQTDADRLLFIVFVTRKKLIRVVSARDMNRKERTAYHSS